MPASNVAKTKKATPRALLDTGGGRSLITADLVQQLELSSASSRRIHLTGLNNTPVSSSTSAKKLLLYPLKGKPVEIEVFVVPDIVDDIISSDVADLKKQYPKYADMPIPEEGNGERIQLLLGYSSLAKMVSLQKSIRINDQLQLMGTRFGWVPFGDLPAEKDDPDNENAPICVLKIVDPMKLMSDLETVGLAEFARSKTDEEMIALEQFNKTIKRIGKQYQIEWPYRYDPPDLEENFGVAFGRLVSLYKQLQVSPELLQAYDKIIREQVESNIVEIVNTRRLQKNGRIHYLPHRGVVRFGKSTPIRMVFDASSKAGKNSRSLNDNILKGGNWVNEIPGIHFVLENMELLSQVTSRKLSIRF